MQEAIVAQRILKQQAMARYTLQKQGREKPNITIASVAIHGGISLLIYGHDFETVAVPGEDFTDVTFKNFDRLRPRLPIVSPRWLPLIEVLIPFPLRVVYVYGVAGAGSGSIAGSWEDVTSSSSLSSESWTTSHPNSPSDVT